MVDKLVPALKRALTDELNRRQTEVSRVEMILNELFLS